MGLWRHKQIYASHSPYVSLMSVHLSLWDPVCPSLLGDHVPLTPSMLDAMWNLVGSEKMLLNE